MRLLINTASTFKGGGVQVAKSFIEEAVRFTQHEYHVVLGTAIANVLGQKDYPSNFFFYHIPYRPATRVFSLRSPDSFLSSLEKRIKPDCVFTTSGPAYWRPKAPHLLGYNLPHYIYPDSPFFKTLSAYKRLYWTFKGMVIRYYIKRDADAYVVQTKDVNSRLRKWIAKENVHTVTNTYSADFKAGKKGAPMLPVPQPGEFRFLMLSAWYKHKNFEIINAISDVFKAKGVQGIKFILTLPSEIFDSIFTSTAKSYIYNIGPVKPDDCPRLYGECHATFLPSLLECFSATYAESMVMRRPIMTSDLGFARTICGAAALYVNPLDAQEIVSKMETLKESQTLQKKLIDHGESLLTDFYNSSERAGAYIDLCNTLLRRN